MKPIICFLLFAFLTSISHAQTFKIDSYYYIDSAPKPNEQNSKVVFTTDRIVTCQGVSTNKIFINKNTKNNATSPYYLTQFWPSYFYKRAALVKAEIEADLGLYNAAINACEIGYLYNGSSQQRWYEPHKFKVSENNDSNPINKIYYQLYIDASRPTYGAWVYADTDYEITCDGVSTNRVIPTTNSGVNGNVIPNEFGSQVNASYSSENTRSFLDLLGGKLELYTIGSYMPELNGCLIYDTVYSENNTSSESMAVGVQQCIDDPQSCDLFNESDLNLALELGIQDGISSCIDSPESCGLFGQNSIDLAYESGEVSGTQNCVDFPEGCGLFNQSDLDETLTTGMELGEQNCKLNPESCDLFDQSDIQNAIANGRLEGNNECKLSPSLCDLFNQNDMNETRAEGEESARAACIANPASCELYNDEQVKLLVDEGVTSAVKDVADILPKGVLKQICKKYSSLLVCDYLSERKKHKHKHHKHEKKYKHDKYYKYYKYYKYGKY